ncbi:hypothetical protein SAM9427_34605, partial [Streptomyces sp. ETH9427]
PRTAVPAAGADAPAAGWPPSAAGRPPIPPPVRLAPSPAGRGSNPRSPTPLAPPMKNSASGQETPWL